MSDAKKPDVVMAKAISAVVCEHGSLYIRLHDASGKIFAAACMDRKTGFGLVGAIVKEFDEPSAECGGCALMRVLVACEFSGIVRRAFAARGHDAWSCDLLPAEDGSNQHIIADARDLLDGGWDLLMVAHPPCTRLCNSGVRWLSAPPSGKTLSEMWSDLRAAAALFSAFWNAPIERICIENPVMHRHAKALIQNYADPAQSVQPWQFGHGETKRTCFWLRKLPKLMPTRVVEGRTQRVFRMSPGPDRWRERSRFFPGIADAMAEQWGRVGLSVPPAQLGLFG